MLLEQMSFLLVCYLDHCSVFDPIDKGGVANHTEGSVNCFQMRLLTSLHDCFFHLAIPEGRGVDGLVKG